MKRASFSFGKARPGPLRLEYLVGLDSPRSLKKERKKKVIKKLMLILLLS